MPTRSLSDIELSTAANDVPASALFSAPKNPQRIPVNTTPVFRGLRPCICQYLLHFVTNGNAGQAPRNESRSAMRTGTGLRSASAAVRPTPRLTVWGTLFAAIIIGLALPATTVLGASAAKEFPITFDATNLEPPSLWQIPGLTPAIWTLDPESTDALRTAEVTELRLKPGTYSFSTFTFSFQFTVTQDGTLEFEKKYDQCVSGRGTRTLLGKCKRMQPYGGQRDYEY